MPQKFLMMVDETISYRDPKENRVKTYPIAPLERGLSLRFELERLYDLVSK